MPILNRGLSGRQTQGSRRQPYQYHRIGSIVAYNKQADTRRLIGVHPQPALARIFISMFSAAEDLLAMARQFSDRLSINYLKISLTVMLTTATGNGADKDEYPV